MPRGVVKRWNGQKGFGFIASDDHGDDVFVHQSALQMEGYRCLNDGEVVEFEVQTGEDGRVKASNVTGPEGAPLKGVWNDVVPQSGTVVRWRSDKGFGFIKPDAEGAEDVFV